MSSEQFRCYPFPFSILTINASVHKPSANIATFYQYYQLSSRWTNNYTVFQRNVK